MHILLFLSTSECLLLKDFTTEFLYGGHKTSFDCAGNLMAVPTNNDIFEVNNNKPPFYWQDLSDP